MNLTNLNFGNLKPKLPIIQGGMGVGISLHKLAGNVAKEGGIGILSAAQIGYKEADFIKNPLASNLKALKEEFLKAKEISPKGIIGVNIMVALKNYAEYAKKAVEIGVDLIISGAGLPIDLPLFTKGSSTKIAPIVSSAKAANVICKMWDKKHSVAPDLVVIEGPLAGGHLGFSVSDLEKNINVLDILAEVKEIIKPYEIKYNREIPVVVAGGFYNGDDIKNALMNGADGVQMGTRFVTTYECDAPDSYKAAYIHSKKDDISIIKSPVGMPGRAILNDYIRNSSGNKSCLYHCLHKCDVTNIPYCISQALISAAIGDVDNSLLFCGSNAYKATHLEYLHDIFEEIKTSIVAI